MQQLQLRALHLARGSMPVLITGASGTGKNKLAYSMHKVSGQNAPFVTLICADIPEDRFEQTLFGNGDLKQGVLESARGGTLLLDEVGEMPLSVQSRLAHMLDAGTASGALGVKVLASSAYDVAQQVHEGRFRSDLLFRLSATNLKIPPLVDRTDLDWLIDRLLRIRTVALPQVYRLSAAARRALHAREWPGNVRELINTLDVAIAMAQSNTIELEDLPDPVLPPAPEKQARKSLALNELQSTLDICDWNIARAARHLGIDRSTLHRRIKRIGLSRPA